MTSSRYPATALLHAFPGITPEEITLLIENASIEKYPAGTVLCHEGAYEHTFYIVLDGKAHVTRHFDESEKLLSALESGDFFGEMALLHNAPRIASVTAATPLTVMEIKRAAFERVLRNSTAVAVAMAREIGERLRSNDQIAIEAFRLRAAEMANAYQVLAEQDFLRRQILNLIASLSTEHLHAAQSYVAMLGSPTMNEKARKEAAEKTSRQLEYMKRLLATLAYLHAGKVSKHTTSVDLHELVDQIANNLKKEARQKNIDLRVRKSWRLSRVPAAPAALEHVFYLILDAFLNLAAPKSDVTVHLGQHQNCVLAEITTPDFGKDLTWLQGLLQKRLEPLPDDALRNAPWLILAAAGFILEQHNGALEVTSEQGQLIAKATLPTGNPSSGR